VRTKYFYGYNIVASGFVIQAVCIGPLLAGRIFDLTGSYQILFLVLTGVTVLGFMLIILLRPLQGAGEKLGH